MSENVAKNGDGAVAVVRLSDCKEVPNSIDCHFLY